MVLRWNCRRCEFDTWAADTDTISDTITSHELKHHKDNVMRKDFEVNWECPYCSQTSHSYDDTEAIQKFKDHLFEHVKPLIQSDVHIADTVDRAGDILVTAPVGGRGATRARVHFTSPADFALFVTSQPAERVRLLAEELNSWPSWSAILTTKQQPFADITGIDLESAPVEVVILDKRCGLKQLGETVARVLDEHETSSAKVSVEFDILSELLTLFDLKTVFKFVHVLNARLENADALTHYYLNPDNHPESSVNMLTKLFDLTISTRNGAFVSNS